jgi:CRISPR-associated protein Csb3
VNDQSSNLSVDVDVTNPGQFFACCGMLELAHRLWPGSEGWFAEDQRTFSVRGPEQTDCTIDNLLGALVKAGVQGELSPEERSELERLERKKRELKKKKKELSSPEEQRRKWLGRRQREGAILIRDPFNIRISWWQEEGDDVPKTFAGKQEVLRMAEAMLSKVREAVRQKNRSVLGYRCLLSTVAERSGDGSKVEPFCFDATRFAHALDVGFSLDVQERTMRATAAPITELLALIGLQRFRPRRWDDSKWSFAYWTWRPPLAAPVAAAVASGSVSLRDSRGYRFSLRFRDDQKRYKAFGFATPIGGNA